MGENKYWQHFGEVNDPKEAKKLARNEFAEELPFEGFDDESIIDAKAPRRDFLKYLGFSTAAATLAASCKMPVRKAVPFADKPSAEFVPGEAIFYATTYVQDGDVVPVLAKVRDGRPIKIEGNSAIANWGGGTSSRVQASVLDLYDTARLRTPFQRSKDGKSTEKTFEQIDKQVADAIKAAGGTTVLLTSSVVSPSTKEIISKFPNLKHVQYDAVSYSGMLLANEACGFGRKIPSYNFSEAKVIVSLGADFLGTWLSPVEFAAAYAKGRKIDEKNPSMSKHYQFEGTMSMTGANADERFTHRPSETGAVAVALLNAVNGAADAGGLNADLTKGINKAAADLKAAGGNALVVCGSNDKNIQVVVNAINNAIGANGKTINWAATVNYRQGVDADFAQLVADMEAGNVGTLLIHGANPAYTWYDADKFKAALKKVKVTVSFNEKLDETTELCEYLIPNHHYLESWGDAEAAAGNIYFIQPTIYPLFKTRYYQTSLLLWSGNNTPYEDYYKEYWKGKFASDAEHNKALQSGVKEAAAATAGAGSYSGSAVAEATTAIAGYKKSSGDELVLYQKVSIGTGAQAGNPWLQELPDPVSKATWDNYAIISTAKAKELGIDYKSNDYNYYPQKPVIELTVGNKKLELPALVFPGINANTIAVAVGYGRNNNIGKVAAGVGKNAYPFATYNGTSVDYNVSGVTTTNLHKSYKIAQMQKHDSYESRKEVVRETTMASFKANPNVIPESSKELTDMFYKNANNDFRAGATLYPDPNTRSHEIKWGMSIDMNLCNGCNACVAACHAENNVPVVGKSEVLRYHDMHWLRIDRYFVTDDKNPDNVKGVVFQPMLCQHCDNAPCENVCPVAATNHSSEGINQMTYNRCVGTRYCANNCPYKVRRFNWADYTGSDSFPNNQDQQIVGKLDDAVHVMNDDLSRMVLNPDVTVRSRGVIEKCSFCVQRTQHGKLEAKKANRPLGGNDVKSACQTACPTNAIVFGNAYDATSDIAKLRAENPQRNFHVLEQLHVLPNVTYMAKIRNTDEVDEHWAGHHE